MYNELRTPLGTAVRPFTHWDIQCGLDEPGYAQLTLAAPLDEILSPGHLVEVWLGFDPAHCWPVMKGTVQALADRELDVRDALADAIPVAIHAALVDSTAYEVMATAFRAAGVRTGTISRPATVTVPRVVLSGESLLQVARIVDRTWSLGYHLVAQRDGSLTWGPLDKSATYQFEYGANIIECEWSNGRGRLLTILAPFVEHDAPIAISHPAVPGAVHQVLSLRHFSTDSGAGRTEIIFGEVARRG